MAMLFAKLVATIALGGEAGNTVFDPASGQIYVAVQTQNQLAKQPIIRAEPNDSRESEMLVPALSAAFLHGGMRANTGSAARTSRQGVGH